MEGEPCSYCKIMVPITWQAVIAFIRSEGGRRTNRVSMCSHCVLLGSSCLWLSIRYSCVSWVYFDVATSVATCFLTVVLVDSLLPSLSYSLLHRCRVSIVAVHWCLEMFTSCSFHACFAHLVPLTSFPITSFAVKIAVARGCTKRL